MKDHSTDTVNQVVSIKTLKNGYVLETDQSSTIHPNFVSLVRSLSDNLSLMDSGEHPELVVLGVIDPDVPGRLMIKSIT